MFKYTWYAIDKTLSRDEIRLLEHIVKVATIPKGTNEFVVEEFRSISIQSLAIHSYILMHSHHFFSLWLNHFCYKILFPYLQMFFLSQIHSSIYKWCYMESHDSFFLKKHELQGEVCIADNNGLLLLLMHKQSKRYNSTHSGHTMKSN